MNKRRRLITALGAGALAAPFCSLAQQAGRVWRVGVLSALSPAAVDSSPFSIFRASLGDLGYVEGKNTTFAYRWADGNRERLSVFAEELAALKVDVILSGPGTPTAIAAMKATTTIPIVFIGAGDAVGAGIVKSLARPGGNITGLVNQSEDAAGKQAEIFKEAIPQLSRVGVLRRPSNPSYKNLLQRYDRVVRATGIQVVIVDADSSLELVAAFESTKKERLQGLIVQADDLFIREAARIVQLAATYRLPAMYRLSEHAAGGGLMAYGPSIPDMYRRAGYLVDKILKGANPAELPVEQPTKFELVINMKTAKTLGIKIPNSVLLRADKIIE